MENSLYFFLFMIEAVSVLGSVLSLEVHAGSQAPILIIVHFDLSHFFCLSVFLLQYIVYCSALKTEDRV